MLFRIIMFFTYPFQSGHMIMLHCNFFCMPYFIPKEKITIMIWRLVIEDCIPLLLHDAINLCQLPLSIFYFTIPPCNNLHFLSNSGFMIYCTINSYYLHFHEHIAINSTKIPKQEIRTSTFIYLKIENFQDLKCQKQETGT